MMLAFAKFNQAHPDSLLALHTGVHQDGGQDLEYLAEALGITDKTRVVDQYRYAAGLIPAESMAEWYGSLDLLCGATYAEGFGIPVVEALACGIPVVTTGCSIDGGAEPGRVPGGRVAVLQRRPPGLVAASRPRRDLAGVRAAYEDRGSVNPVKLRDSVAGYDMGMRPRST